MRLPALVFTVVFALASALGSCSRLPADDASATPAQPLADSDLAAFVAKIRAVDNHTHPNSLAPADTDADALPLDGLMPIELPVRFGLDNPEMLAAYRTMYQYPHADMSEAHLKELRGTMQRIAKAKGDSFPAWVLDQVGTEVMLANRVAMGPGLTSSRFRWVSFADPLLYPLSNRNEAAVTPDRAKLFPLTAKLLRRYLADLTIARVPATLDGYLKTVVTPTLEAQRRGGAVAIKFEAAYLRSLDFGDASALAATGVYARYAAGGDPSRADYKTLQDFLFRYIAREAGRLGMPVHVHAFNGAGNYFSASGADPALMEPMLNDSTLRATRFVIVHGGGAYSAQAGALLWKPNVYADISFMTLAYSPSQLADILRGWLLQFPNKVLFGTDASAFGPDAGWDVVAAAATGGGRTALAIALTEMVRRGEVSRIRAKEIATMVMRTNAATLHDLRLR